MTNLLLPLCICGGTETTQSVEHDLNIDTCSCGIKRQRLEMTESDYFAFYAKDYHGEHQTSIGHETYAARYEHDLGISAMRYDIYTDFLPEKATTLDIGSSNNAFVDFMIGKGHDAYGIELSEELSQHPTTYNTDLLELNLESDKFDLVTLHDVFEHLIDPIKYLNEIKRIMKPGAMLVIDLPHYFVPEGVHHWRPVEHLWIFSEKDMHGIIDGADMELVKTDVPIPSKIVFYIKK